MDAQTRYQAQLQVLLGELDPQARKFFGTVSLHDGSLRAVTVRVPEIRSPKMSVIWEVEAADGNRIYRLGFSNVERFDIDRFGARDLHDEHDKSMGTWGYDELTRRDASTYRYQVLFSSGATFTIDFDKVRVTKQKSIQ